MAEAAAWVAAEAEASAEDGDNYSLPYKTTADILWWFFYENAVQFLGFL